MMADFKEEVPCNTVTGAFCNLLLEFFKINVIKSQNRQNLEKTSYLNLTLIFVKN